MSSSDSDLAVLDLPSHRGKVGFHVSVSVTGSGIGIVYGSSIYSDDSCLHTAAVHAGIVNVGQSKTVIVVTKGPQKRLVLHAMRVRLPARVLHLLLQHSSKSKSPQGGWPHALFQVHELL